MRTFKFAVPAAVLMGGLFLCTSVSFGKAEYTKKEKKGCTFCHVSAGSKDLNAAGQYYKAHNHSLDGYNSATKKN
ncbi:MAG: hypothetical protein M1541_20780 [Acidobacteria bacterium]|nr:hypothetical protein [Acidobacteriota bacterium]